MEFTRITDIIEYRKSRYIFLKLIPSSSIRNYNSDKILTLIASLYRSIDNRVRAIDKKICIEGNAKVAYYIYMEKNKVEFYFIVPESHYNLFKDKIIDIWHNKITITQVNELPIFDKNCTAYYMWYKKEDAMSLTCDKRNNYLLGSILNTLHIMDKGDKVGVLYNFTPANQKTWRVEYDKVIEKLKRDEPINKNKLDFWYLVKKFFLLVAKIADTTLEIVSLGNATESKPTKNLMLSQDTIKKRDAIIVKAQILCLSESQDKQRELNNALTVCESFKCLENDNTLIYRKYKKKNASFDLISTKIKGVKTMKIQPLEGQNFISLPGRELLEEHKVIEHTNILETEVPEKLRTGYISLGFSKYKGNEIEAFHRDNYDQGNFPLVLIGEQGSGKSTYISNYVKYIQRRDEGCMLIDYIKNCELADSIKKASSSSRVIELDMSDVESAQGIGYNELVPKSDKPLDILDIANRKALYIQMLIDALNTDGDPLSSSMDRYLSAAANIVFLNSAASLKDVVRCLNDYNYRHAYLDSIPFELRDYLSEEIGALLELDDTDKDGNIIGTRMTKIDGINHRINLLRKDLRLKMMFNKGCQGNIDLVQAMEDGKIILVKMPQEYFATPYSKNVIVTYLFTKIWAATLIRGSRQAKPKRFHIIVDEIFQSRTAMKMLREQEILPQTRKFGCKFVFSCQYLGQIELIDQTLRSAGASYMLMKGSGKANFNEFKDELAPYTLEDLEALPRYSSLNLINYEDGRAKFVTQLPKPL